MEQEEQNIDLTRYLGVLLHGWWVVVLVAVSFTGTAYIYSSLTKETVYSARATILIQDSGSGIGPGLGNIRASSDLARTYLQLLTTRPLLEKVIEEMGIPYNVNSLRSQVRVSVRGGTALMDVTVRTSDPDSTVRIANTLAQVFIQDRQTSRLADIARLEALAAAQGTTDTSALVQSQLSTLGSMSIVEEAIIAKPSVTPSLRNNMLIGGFLGVFFGVLLAFFVDYSSNRIKSVEQIDRLFQLGGVSPSIMGVVFEWTAKEVAEETLVVENSPDSIYSEMFRQVRTGFQFATVANPGKAFLITSVGPREGKSTIMSNLGAALAQGGSRVTIVDSDLRRPTLHRFHGLDRRAGGLSTLIADTEAPASYVRGTSVPGLSVLPSGPVPTNPADLLSSPRMAQIIDQLGEDCDFLLLDSPPIVAAADSTILASKVDGVILVVTMGETRTDTFRDVLRQIQRADTPILGYLVNKVKTQRLGYGSYRYRYHYYYYYRRDDEDGEHSHVDGDGAEPGSNRRAAVLAARVRSRVRHLLNRNSRGRG